MTEIVQCPYCPADLNPAVRLRDDAGIIWVACGRCGARGPMYVTTSAVKEEYKIKAIHAWNTVANQSMSTKDMVPMALEAQETIETLRKENKVLWGLQEKTDQFMYAMSKSLMPWLDIASPAATPPMLESYQAAIRDAIKYQTILQKYGKTFKSLFDEVEGK